MNVNKKKKRIIIFGLLVLIILIFLIIKVFNGQNIDEEKLDDVNEYVYKFGETLNLETANGIEEYEAPDTGTDSFGNLEGYDESDVVYDEDKMIIQTFDGNQIISSSWIDEGKANLISPPEFGELEKFILYGTSITAKYTNVKIKDLDRYINQLAGMGFNEVSLDNKNKKKDYYYYTAGKGEDSSVSLDYSDGVLYINVY